MSEDTFEIVDPTGRQVLEPIKENSLPDTLDGKTVAFVWDYLFKGPEMFDAFKREIEQRFTDVKFVDYEVFGNIHGSDPEEKENLGQMPERLRGNNVDIAVVAVGA